MNPAINQHEPTLSRQQPPEWYMKLFVCDPDRGYDIMKPPEAPNKYGRRSTPLTPDRVTDALEGRTDLMQIEGRKVEVPYSFAVVPETRSGWARAAIIDIDHGGLEAVQRALAVAQSHGLWAFAQLSTSDAHDGGHVYIPTRVPQPASLLHGIATRVQAGAHVEGESYPSRPEGNHQSLRLPLMLHLRAPGGPRRFPLLLPSEEQIDATDPWVALVALGAQLQPNSTEALTRALDTLPILSVKARQPLHKSQVNSGKQASVISWYNGSHSLEQIVGQIGVRAVHGVAHCPWHDDRSPSLVFWQHHDGKQVCRCFSAHSNCPAANPPYLDAFDVQCLISNRQAADVAAELVAKHKLGRQRELCIADVGQRADPAPAPELLSAHEAAIGAARAQLAAALDTATSRRGTVTNICAIPGLGKTYYGADCARSLHAAGKRVAVAVPTHNVACEEWAPLVPDAVHWQPRSALCTCYQARYLEKLGELGYRLPDCRPGCPYQRQREASKGKIVLYQHNHLHLYGGKLLEGVDVVIVDESPIGALLQEYEATQADLKKQVRQLGEREGLAVTLINALMQIPRDAKSLSGEQIIGRLHELLGDDLIQIVTDVCNSQAAAQPPPPEPTTDLSTLPTAIFGKIVRALAHDLRFPNKLLAYKEGRWLISERRAFLEQLQASEAPPAVVVLDGSADPLICTQLYAPWPVELTRIEVPISPLAEIVQCCVTPSTRKVLDDESRLDSLTRAIAAVCGKLGVVLDGGVSYKDAIGHFAEALGGTWLHYGGQRGRNDLKMAKAVAIVASPTMPPDAMERRAKALWADATELITCAWVKRGKGYYVPTDPRLQAVSDLAGYQELYQALHRCRPILADAPITLLVFSPWSIAELGLAPHKVVEEVPYGNSKASRQGYEAYQRLRAERA